MRYAVVEGCPVPAKLAPYLRRFLSESGATLQSCYRGADAEALLNRLGKKSQSQLWVGWQKRLPGYYPANPPGRSTHELRSDGVAYAGPVGRRLVWWQVGIDLDDAHVDAFIEVAARHGWKAHRPYPTGSEFHHVNFERIPLRARLKLR